MQHDRAMSASACHTRSIRNRTGAFSGCALSDEAARAQEAATLRGWERARPTARLRAR
jgi:hypothetical protein